MQIFGQSFGLKDLLQSSGMENEEQAKNEDKKLEREFVEFYKNKVSK